jgi:very-short-patch-repair endonuclease
MEGVGWRHHKMRGTTAEIQQVARVMRREMTPAETMLWQALKGRRLSSLRFRAQHTVGQFVLDFYCPICKLAVEIDGVVHQGRETQDLARTQHLEAHGYHVIRFYNNEVLSDLPSVLEAILTLARKLRPDIKADK